MIRNSILIFITSFALGCVGCDPVRKTSQPVTVQVIDTSTREVVPDVQVRMKVDFDRAYPLSEETLQPTERWHKRKREFWKKSPWFSASTDDNGVARIDVEYSAIDRSMGREPPDDRDIVTGEPYLIQMAQNEKSAEALSVVMENGTYAKGKRYGVKVIDVGKTRYIEQH